MCTFVQLFPFVFLVLNLCSLHNFETIQGTCISMKLGSEYYERKTSSMVKICEKHSIFREKVWYFLLLSLFLSYM